MTLTRLKIAVLTPIPRASTATAATVNPGGFQSCRNAKRKSWIIKFLRSQGLHWVDPRRAHCGNETGQRGDGADKQSDAAVKPGIARTHFEKQPLHQASDREGNAEADHEAGNRQPQSFFHDEPDHVTRGGAEREADAKFVGPLRNTVGDDGINSHSGEGERESGKTAQQIHRELAISRRRRENLRSE